MSSGNGGWHYLAKHPCCKQIEQRKLVQYKLELLAPGMYALFYRNDAVIERFAYGRLRIMLYSTMTGGLLGARTLHPAV